MDKFVCPICNYTVERSNHYLAIVEAQNFINTVMGNEKIIDLCGKCNYFEYENKGEKNNE